MLQRECASFGCSTGTGVIEFPRRRCIALSPLLPALLRCRTGQGCLSPRLRSPLGKVTPTSPTQCASLWLANRCLLQPPAFVFCVATVAVLVRKLVATFLSAFALAAAGNSLAAHQSEDAANCPPGAAQLMPALSQRYVPGHSSQKMRGLRPTPWLDGQKSARLRASPPSAFAWFCHAA